MEKPILVEINDTNISSLQILANEADIEGYPFVQKTITEWKNGTNAFSKPGEKLWGLFVDDTCVGIGGLNQDPYVRDALVGRVRHVYISRKYRGRGLSKVLLGLIVAEARKSYTKLRLSTSNPIAASLYESAGFAKAEGQKVTHIMDFQ